LFVELMSFARGPSTPQARSTRSEASSIISTDRPLSARVLDRYKHVARQKAAKEGLRPETSDSTTARATLKLLSTSKRRPQRLGGNLLDVPDVDECDVTGFRRVGDWCICEICTCGWVSLGYARPNRLSSSSCDFMRMLLQESPLSTSSNAPAH
jgi:hypothetical protein